MVNSSSLNGSDQVTSSSQNGGKNVLKIVEHILTIIIVLILLAISVMIALAEYSAVINSQIIYILHIDIRGEIAYLLHLLQQLHG